MKTGETFLVADIGGTNARFAAVDGESGEWLGKWQAKVEDYPALADVIAEATVHLLPSPSVAAVCLAVGGPIVDDHIQFTNSRWSFSKHSLKKQFNWPRLLVINDFRAAAYGILTIPVDRHCIVGELKSDKFCQPSAVVGPGTGLGAAGLYPHQNTWLVVPTEVGHARWAVASQEEFELWRLLQSRRPVDPSGGVLQGIVQREDILSGPGIAVLYQAVAELQGELTVPSTTEDIVELASRHDDTLCVATVQLFCRLLGRALADIALDLGVRGSIFLAGGVLPRIKQLFLRSGFSEAFSDHPKFQFYLQSINIFLVEEENLGLMGAHAALLVNLGRPFHVADCFKPP